MKISLYLNRRVFVICKRKQNEPAHFQQDCLGTQRRLRADCASTHSKQILCRSSEDSTDVWLSAEHKAVVLIRLFAQADLSHCLADKILIL